MSVKRSYVVPNEEWIEHSVVLSLHEHAAAVWLNFDGADATPSKEFAAENSAAGSGKKAKLSHSLREQCQLIQFLRTR
jgi:hypothetical protein